MVAAWYVVFMPMRAEVVALQVRLANTASEIQRGSAAAMVLPALEREVRKLESELEAIQSVVTTPPDQNSVIADLQSAAADSHLRITALKPRQEPAPGNDRGQSVELGIEGTFHDVGRFLGRLASPPRVRVSSDVNVRARTSGRGGGNVTATIVVVAFDLSSDASGTDELLAYDDGGRRDPFASLIAPEVSPRALAASNRGRGLAATPVADVVVRGVTRDGNRMLAILETSGRQSFIVRPLDRLADSVVHDINPSGVLFVQRDGRGGPVQVHKPIRPSSVERP
jgi:Tfp pilus assembly protein PilO